MNHKAKFKIAAIFGKMIVNAANDTAHVRPYMSEIGNKVSTVIWFGIRMEKIQIKKNTKTAATTKEVYCFAKSVSPIFVNFSVTNATKSANIL